MSNKVTFKVDGVLYSTPGSVEEIKTARFIKYIETVVQDTPAALVKAVTPNEDDESETIETRFNNLTNQEKKDCFLFFSKVVSFWTGAPEAKLKALSLEQLQAAFWTLEYMFMSYKPSPDFCGFEAEGVYFEMPQKHMTKSTFIEFAEAAQYEESLKDFNSGSYIALLDIMCIICRPPGEQYDDKNNPKRKKIFANTSLDIALNVGFFLRRLNNGLSQILTIYSLMLHQAKAEEAQLIRRLGGMQS
jgi:hypothetical protein